MVGWKEPEVQKRRKRFFTGVCEKLSKYHLNLFVVIERVFTDWFFLILDIFLLLCTSGNFLFKFIYLNQGIITLQICEGTRTDTFTIYMKILNWMLNVVIFPFGCWMFFKYSKLFLALFANTVNFLETDVLFEGLLFSFLSWDETRLQTRFITPQ